jgi:hypothetical protein
MKEIWTLFENTRVNSKNYTVNEVLNSVLSYSNTLNFVLCYILFFFCPERVWVLNFYNQTGFLKTKCKECFLCGQQMILKMLTDKEVKTVDRG